MIDIHCHILPMVDDGASDLSEAIEMAREAVKDGIHTVIATPHYYNGKYMNERVGIRESVNGFRAVLAEQDIPLQVLCGQEVRMHEKILDDFDKGLIQLLNDSDYILIEFPSSKIPDFVDEVFHEIYLMGKIPVIAHPERNKAIADDPDKLFELISKGALAQLTSHSISGELGRKLQRLSLELCRRNLIHFIASDAHNTGNRPFMLSEAYRIIRNHVDQDTATYLLHNAECVVNSRKFNKREPLPAKRRWYSFW